MNAGTRGGRSPVRTARPRGASSAASVARYSCGTVVNSVASNTAMAVRTSSSGSGAIMRRSDVRHRSVISSRRRRRMSRSSDGVSRGSSSRASRIRAAAQGDEGGPPAGLGRMGGQDGADAQPGQHRVELRLVVAGPAELDHGLGHGVVEEPVAGGPLAASEGADATARLRQVDQLEVDREGGDDRLRSGQVEAVEVGRLPLPVVRVLAPAQGDGAPPDALHGLVGVLPCLLDDHLPEEGAEQPDLARQRVTGAGRTDARRLRASGRDGPGPHPATEWVSRLPPSRNLRRTPPQPSATATFPTLVW